MKKPVELDFVGTGCGLYKPKGKNMKKNTKRIISGAATLAAIVAIAFACCVGCDDKEKRNNMDKNELADVQEQINKLISLNEALKQKNKSLVDSLVFYKDSLKNVSDRLADCEKVKRCPVKKAPVKVPAKAPVKKPAPVVVKLDTTKPTPVVVKPDTVVVKHQVVIQDEANHNVININNGTVNNCYGPAADTTKCCIIVRAKITQTIKTR